MKYIFLFFLFLYSLGVGAVSISTTYTTSQTLTTCRYVIDGTTIDRPVYVSSNGDKCQYNSSQDVIGRHTVSIRYCNIVGETTDCSNATPVVTFNCSRQHRGASRISCIKTRTEQ